jgi:heavy metal efflux system protein
MINRLVRAALAEPLLTLIIFVALAGLGVWSFTRLPVDAYPDLSPPMVEIITQWPGRATEEVERLITVPVEVAMNGIPNLKYVRSISLYGLSDIIMTFDDGTDDYFAREQAFERLGDATLPNGVSPSMAPLSAPSGLVYRYVLESPDRSPMQLKTIDDWDIVKAYKSVPGVADLSPLGGPTMQYQVIIDPTKLAGAGLTVPIVANALAANNDNSGGGFYSEGGSFYYVRGLGRVVTPQDIGNIVLAVKDGIPVLVKNVANVEIGYAPRLGQFSYDTVNDAVEGVVLMRTGEQAQTVLKAVEAKTAELNRTLPHDIHITPFYDRSELIHLTTRIVEDNLLRGIVLVLVVLVFFLYSARSGLIVAVTIPLSLLFAFICLNVRHIPANLLSIGAIDFGILVDATVVMVENIHRELAQRHGTSYNAREVIIRAAAQVDRPIVYAVAVIVTGFLPIYVLSGPSGRLFTPMADTTIYALVGALLITLTLIPLLCLLLLGHGVEDRRNPIYEWISRQYDRQLGWCLRHKDITLGACVGIFALTIPLWYNLGAEFMPKLDEGALWVRATMPYTISFDESARLVPQIRAVLRSFPEVTFVACEHGRPDDGTDPTGFFNAEFYVGLTPYSTWHGPYRTKPAFIDAVNRKLAQFPGVVFNYTQPAEDAVDEAETGLKSSLDVKVFGTDLTVLEATGRAIKHQMEQTRGITDLTLVQELGQPALTVDIDRDKIAKYGINIADINALIEAAVGGSAATQVVQGEKLFDLVVRLLPQYRETPEAIGNILVATPAGEQIPIRELATIQVSNGAAFIYRQNNSRYIGVQYSVEGRDLASAVEEAQRRVAKNVALPGGYRVVWGGEYQEYTASRAQLQIVLPVTFILIIAVLFALYKNFKFPLITLLGVVLSDPIGGVLALAITGTPFSVSSGIGFLALFGVSVQTAVVYISYANELRADGMEIAEAARRAALLRLRPIMMTALVAALGLLPAALAHGVGTDSQRPFALVIVGGLFSRLLISIYLMPVLYEAAARPGDHLAV